jgi:thymidylate synthase (FAD)
MNVSLIDTLGTDLTVVNAARVSFDKESCLEVVSYDEVVDLDSRSISYIPISKLKKGDEKLINFLAEHNHWSPFAHPQLQFRIKAPIFVARQLGKHQVGLCISGDSEITFVKISNGISNGLYKRKLSDIWKMWSGQIKYQGGEKGRKNISNSHIRVFNEETNRFETSHIVNVIDSGIKDVWLIEDEFGKTIKATEDHKFLTSEGWKRMKDLKEGDLIVSPYRGNSFAKKENNRTNSEDVICRRKFRQSLEGEISCNICKQVFKKESCHVDHILPLCSGGEHKQSNLQILCINCHRKKTHSELLQLKNSTILPKYTKILSKKFKGKEQCFDLSVERIHNFIANGFVVHNCWNEVSRRYVDSEPEFYFPDKWRKKNPDKKQGSMEDEFVDLNFAENCTVKSVVLNCLNLYTAMLGQGVCAEQARMVLPQNMYTEWYWTGSLYAFARVCGLRLKKDTQAETRLIAEQINQLVSSKFPVSWKALTKNK